MTRILRLVAPFALCAGLVACVEGDERPSLYLEIFDTIGETVVERATPAPERPPVTRAELDTLDGSFMEVVVEDRDQLAYLFVSAVRQHPRDGITVEWRSEDNAMLAMRNDILIATRGLGTDLLSSDALLQTPGQIGPRGNGERRMYFLARDNKSVPIYFACEVSDLGAKTITIIERSYRTRHLQERCESNSGNILNEYWIDSSAGFAWQSRQWAGPETGYLRFRRLTQ